MAGVSFYSLREIKRSRALITDSLPSLNDYVQKGEDGVIVIREDLAMLIDAFGSRIAKSLKMSLLQGMGANAKLEKGLEGAIAQDIIEDKLPLLELGGDLVGINVKKYLVKNPRAIGQIMQLAGPYLPQLKGLMGKGQPNQPQGQGHDGVGYK